MSFTFGGETDPSFKTGDSASYKEPGHTPKPYRFSQIWAGETSVQRKSAGFVGDFLFLTHFANGTNAYSKILSSVKVTSKVYGL